MSGGLAPSSEPALGADANRPLRVLLTGASGFVGSEVLRRLVTVGHTAVCLVRDPDKLASRSHHLEPKRVIARRGDVFDAKSIGEAARGAQAVIHLVGIIRPARGGQTFQRVHVQGTRNVVEQSHSAGVQRFVHMSALGTRPQAASQYHRSKWAAEQIVRSSGLAWTIFRPSVICGPQGDFLRMMKRFARPPIRPGYELLHLGMPYFGRGQARLQPISVRDVAECLVRCLGLAETVGQTYELGGPEVFTWKQFYEVCALAICGRRRRQIRVPVFAARLLARTVMKTPLVPALLRFGTDEVLMSQEDSICDVGRIEQTFGLRLRDIRKELAAYAELIP